MEQTTQPRNELAQSIYDKGAKGIQWENSSFFNKQRQEKWTVTYKKMKMDHYLIPYTKNKLKWIKHLNGKPNTIKLLDEKHGWLAPRDLS